jgi:pimeloyl-ACP methyl ester carboxylesterase
VSRSSSSILTRATAALDRTAARFIGERIGRAGNRDATTRTMADAGSRLRELAASYNANTLDNAGVFFPSPTTAQMTETAAGDGPDGSQQWDLRFPSDYVTFLPSARSWYSQYTANNTAHARLWTKPQHRAEPPRPMLIIIHGWGAGEYWMIEKPFEISYWLHHGFDVCAFVLPFHGARVPSDAVAGRSMASPLFPSANIIRTNEAFGQAIYDLRALAEHLQQRGSAARKLGVLGMSLGGYTAALWATVANDLDFAAAMIPAVSMSDLMWRHGAGTALRKRARNNGVDQELLDAAFAVHSPLTRPVRVPMQGRFVIAGRGDRITPPDQAEQLAQHWQCPITWFEGGHLAQVGRHSAFRSLRLTLANQGIGL